MGLYNYIRYFILGGVIMAGSNYLLEKYHNAPALIAYLYCAPTIYLAIMYIIYKSRGLNGYYTFIVHSFINYIANAVFILILIFLIKYISKNVYKDFFIASIIFIAYSIYYFLHIYKLQFKP